MSLSTRLGLLNLAADGDTLTDVDYNQLGKSLDAARRAVWDALGGEGIYSGGATVIGDITSGTAYPALTAVLYDDSGVPWAFVKSTSTTITFTDTSGACTLYLVPTLLTGVSPSAAAGGKVDFSLVAQLTASAAPAHSLALGAGNVTASAFTTWTPASVFKGTPVPVTRTLTAGTGLSGGGTLAADRTFAVDLNELTTDATGGATTDYIPFVDASGSNSSDKVLVSDLITNAGLVTTARQVATGTGLSGGGTLAADRTLSIDQTAALTLTALSPYAKFEVILTSDQGSVTTGNYIGVDWTNATRSLTGLSWSAGTPTRLTVSTGYGGFYSLEGLLAWDANTTGRRMVVIRKNGSAIAQLWPSATLTSNIIILQVAYLGALAAGDYIELLGYQDSGADRTYKAASSGAQVAFRGVRLFA